MPSWDEVIGSVDKHPNGVLDIIRNNHIKMLAAKRGRNVICYYSGWLQDLQRSSYCSLSDSDMEGFMTNIHGFDRNKGLDLVLHTPIWSCTLLEAIWPRRRTSSDTYEPVSVRISSRSCRTCPCPPAP